MKIAVTGSAGLVGSALTRALARSGVEVVDIDLRGVPPQDVRDRGAMVERLADVDGVVHLAAVSRVLWGQRDPEGCWSTNVDGTRSVLDACARADRQPWVLFASSREAYGQAAQLPVSEDCPLKPVNIYGRSKVAGEDLVGRAGLRAAIVRLANVYGSVADHPDRVVPAFCRAAVRGDALQVEGEGHVFDFTHIDDVTDGLLRMIEILGDGRSLPPIHLLPGRPTTLGALARLAIETAGQGTIVHGEPRSYDVSAFFGDPGRAAALLGWRARVPLEEGVARLISDLREGASA